MRGIGMGELCNRPGDGGRRRTAERYRRWGTTAIDELWAGLDRLRRAVEVAPAAVPAAALPSQSRDFGP
ncbi:MAG: hypothetical protein U0556_06980 [Dehalococcoidia bacterium]